MKSLFALQSKHSCVRGKMLRRGIGGAESAGNLKYGDVVLLYYTVDKRFATTSGNKSGFVLADLSGSCSHQVLTIHPGDIDKELPNIQYGTFRVVSFNKHDAQDRFTALEEKLEELKKQQADGRSISLLERQIAQVKRDCQVEMVENGAKQKRIQGANVKYGDRIQLQHILTGRFVCASITDTSITDSSKLRVFLQEKDSIGCIFCLRPKKKVTTGEEVNYDDQIKVESMATLGQYLHCSRLTFGKAKINSFQESFELNLSAKDSPIRLICYSQPSKGNFDEANLKARSIVQLIHRKHQCYVVGEGSFVGNAGQLSTLVEDEEDDSGVLGSMNRSRSVFSLTASTEFQVTVDVEPTVDTEPFLKSTTKLSSPDMEAPNDRNPSFDNASSVEGSVISKKRPVGDEVINEDVHFQRKNKSATKPSSQSSAFAFWQVEKLNHPCSGELMEWSEECRIKHLITGQYLSVTGNSPDFKVTLRSSKTPFESTIFELHSDIHEARGEISLESSVRIRHKKTGTWLHLDKDVKYDRVTGEITNESAEKAKELYQVIATKDINSEDIFTLEKVDDEVVKDFNTVASITAVLAGQIAQCESLGRGPHLPKECGMNAVLSSLSSLKYLGVLLQKKTEVDELKKLQKLLRCMKTLILVVRLMNLHRAERGHDPEVCTACFGIIIHFLQGKSTKNKAHISEMMGHIFTTSLQDTKLYGDLAVENALIGIAKENPKVLYRYETMRRIIRYVTRILKGISKGEPKAVQLLEILTAVCSCKGVPVKHNQMIIVEELQAIYSQDRDGKLLYSLRRKPQKQLFHDDKSFQMSIEIERHHSKRKKARRKSYFEKISETENVVQYQETELEGTDTEDDEGWCNLSNGSQQFHKFFVAQVNLLAAMCRGNNTAIITTLQADRSTFGVKLDFELVMSAIIDHKLRMSHPNLVAALVELLKAMFIDIGENRPFLEKVPFAFKFNEMSDSPFKSTTTGEDCDSTIAAATALTGVVNENFSTIRDWIKWFMQNKTEYSFAADEEDQNGVVVKVLQVLTALVKYGYYDDLDDIRALLPGIHELLDGQDDYPTREIRLHHEDKSVDHQDAPGNGFEMKILGQELTTLSTFDLNIHASDHYPEDMHSMKKVLEKYRSSGRFESKDGLENHFQVKHWAIEVLNLLFNFQLYKDLYSFIYDFRSLTQQKLNLQDASINKADMTDKMTTELSHLIEKNPRDLPPRQAEKIFAAAKQRLKYITEESDDIDLSNDQKLPDALIDLACYDYEHLVQRSLMLLDRYYTSKSDIFLKALQSRLVVTSKSVGLFNLMEESLFVQLLSFLKTNPDSDGSGITRSSNIVEELIKYCLLDDEVERYEPHQINQNIILSFGILPDVVNYVLQYCSGPVQVETNQKKKLENCFSLLKALACKNPVVQTRLFEHLDVFIKAASGDLGFEIGELLQEMFIGSPSIALSIKEDQMHRIMQTVFANGKEKFTTKNSALLNALNELLLVKDLDLPLKHNQMVVAKFISLIREDECYWCKELLAAENKEGRQRILKSKDDSDPRLINLLMIADLLATCAIGDNEVIDSICCTIYGEKELISIISSEDISIYRKRPFMKLLVWVYLTAQGTEAEEKYNFYRNNLELWDHMTKTAKVLMRTTDVMTHRLDHSSYLAVKELLASSTWKYSHQCPKRKHSADLPQVVLSGHDDYKEHFQIADVLLYYSEAFLPFLQTYYTEFYRKDECHLDGNTTDYIYTTMLNLYTPLINSKRVYFSHELQVKLYYRVLFLLLPNADCQLSPQLNEIKAKIESAQDILHEKVVTQVRDDYNQFYEDEVELNKNFSQFVLNYKAAYEGRNNTKEQVISAGISKKQLAEAEYSEFLDDLMMKPGPRYLPLGKSFQLHVAKFVQSGLKRRNPKERLLKQLEISLMNGGSKANFDTERQTDLDIKCLQILRALIHNQSILIDEEDKERNPQKYREDCKSHVHPIQDEIQGPGNTVLRVMPLLSHPSERIVHEVLAFLEAILEFGNTRVQEGLKELIQTQEHQVFSTLKTILKRASITFNESELLLSLFKKRAEFDQKIIMRVKMLKSSDQEPTVAIPVSVLRKRNSSSVALARLQSQQPQPKKSSIAALLGRKKVTKTTLIEEEEIRSRLPFLDLYQHTQDNDIIDEEALNNFRFYDLSQITLIAKVLGLMCDGQYLVMQDFLRKQTNDSHNVNMVAEMANFLYEFSKNRLINMETLQVFNQLLQALNEFCVGNDDNRRVIFDANIMSVINYVLQIDITQIKSMTNENQGITAVHEVSQSAFPYAKLRKMSLELKSSAVELLDVMLEAISTKPSNLSQQIAGGLDIPALHWSMQDFFALKDDPDLKMMEFDDNACRALFSCHRVIMYMMDNKLAPMNALKPSGVFDAWNYCEEKSRSIEIVYKSEDSDEEVLSRVHFIMSDEYKINDQLKDKVKFAVDRSTHASKLRDFSRWMDAVKKDTLHRATLDQSLISRCIKKFSRTRRWLLLLTILALNILLIIFSDGSTRTTCPISISYQNGTLNEGFKVEYVVLSYIVGGLFAFLAFWMLLEYFLVTWPHFVLPELVCNIPWIGRLLPTFERTDSSVNLFGIKTIYLVLFIPIAISPLYCFGFLYCFCLFYIIIDNDILQRALQSITRNGKSLLWVAILLLAFLYCYAVISFKFFREDFNDTDSNVFCERLDQCFINVLRFGLVDNFLEIGVRDFNNARLRFLYDVTFFIIVTTIGLNIVFGIIVDTFSELRDEKFTAEQDLKSTCFICNLESYKFDKLSNNGFENHIAKDHNMWDYIFYSIYLDQIDTTDHNATQKYLYDKISNKSIDYIPFHRALVLKGREEEEDELKEELEEIQQSVKVNFNEISQKFHSIEVS